MNYRELSISDYRECRVMYDKFLIDNTIPALLTHDILDTFYFNNEQPLYKIFGGFDEYNVLCTCVFVVFSRYDRSVYVPYAMKYSFASQKTLIETIDFAIKYAIDINFCRIYAAYHDNRYKVWENIIIKKLSMFDRCIAITEEIIPPGRRSSFEKYWYDIQCCKIFQKSITIRAYIITDKFKCNKDL
jgi:hypothetical protein